MKTRIREKLREIEALHGVEILFAVESGSRAWGFASPDSDYDVRFVYRRQREQYLSLWETRDTISFMTEDDLDGSGWDLKKALTLLAKSNGSLHNRLFSPIVYLDREGVLEEMKRLANAHFNPVAGFYHYASMNKGFTELLHSEDLTLKAYFYAIRTALCANWIVRFQTVPPVEFRGLYALLKEEEAELLDALIARKAKEKEKSREKVDERLLALALRVVEENAAEKDRLQSRKANPAAFDELFLNCVK